MKNKQYRLDIIPGIVLALFSIGYMAMIPQIQTFDGMGATPLTNHFIPTLWGSVLLLLSLWIVVRGLRKRKKFLEEGGKVEKTSFRDALMEKIWGIDFLGESRTLDVHIKTLRKKLGDAGKHIKTVRNVGYLLQ